MVVVELVADIEPAACQVVVEQAEGAGAGCYREGDGDVLVERIGRTRVIAHGIEIAHFVAPAGTLQIAGFLAKAVDALARMAQQEMRMGIVPDTEHHGARRALACKDGEGAVRLTCRPGEGERLRDRQAECRGFQRQAAVLALDEGEGGAGKARKVGARTPLEGNVLPALVESGGDGPCPVQTQFAVARQQNPPQRVLQHENLEAMTAVDEKLDAGIEPAREHEGFQRFHDVRPEVRAVCLSSRAGGAAASARFPAHR